MRDRWGGDGFGRWGGFVSEGSFGMAGGSGEVRGRVGLTALGDHGEDDVPNEVESIDGQNAQLEWNEHEVEDLCRDPEPPRGEEHAPSPGFDLLKKDEGMIDISMVSYLSVDLFDGSLSVKEGRDTVCECMDGIGRTLSFAFSRGSRRMSVSTT